MNPYCVLILGLLFLARSGSLLASENESAHGVGGEDAPIQENQDTNKGFPNIDIGLVNKKCPRPMEKDLLQLPDELYSVIVFQAGHIAYGIALLRLIGSLNRALHGRWDDKRILDTVCAGYADSINQKIPKKLGQNLLHLLSSHQAFDLLSAILEKFEGHIDVKIQDNFFNTPPMVLLDSSPNHADEKFIKVLKTMMKDVSYRQTLFKNVLGKSTKGLCKKDMPENLKKEVSEFSGDISDNFYGTVPDTIFWMLITEQSNALKTADKSPQFLNALAKAWNKSGLDINDQLVSPLQLAILIGFMDGIQFILKHKALFHRAEPTRDRSLHTAVKTGNAQIVKLLVQNGILPSQYGQSDEALLHMAYRLSHWDIIRVFEEAEPDFVKKQLCLSPEIFQIACEIGDLDKIKEMEASGFSFFARLKPSHYPIDFALEKKQFGIVEYLRSKNANFSFENKYYLHDAVEDNDLEYAQILIDYGFPIHRQNTEKRDAFYMAIYFGRVAMAQLLLRLGANVSQEFAFHSSVGEEQKLQLSVLIDEFRNQYQSIIKNYAATFPFIGKKD